MEVPRFDVVVRVIEAMRAHGLAPALGGSGLLVALGLADTAHDWDVTVDAPVVTVDTALELAGLAYTDGSSGDAVYATRQRYVIDGGDHHVDVLVGFALRGPDGVERLPTRVTGLWQGIPLADPVVWQRAYTLLNRPEKAALLGRWLARSERTSAS